MGVFGLAVLFMAVSWVLYEMVDWVWEKMGPAWVLGIVVALMICLGVIEESKTTVKVKIRVTTEKEITSRKA